MQVGFTIFLISLAVITPSFESYVSGAETEPNGTRAQANSLSLSASGQASTSGKVNPRTELDYFSIVTPSFSGQLTLTISMTPTSSDLDLDAWLQLQDASGNILVTRDSFGDDVGETISYAATGNTTYYIVCGSADFLSSGSGDYTLQVGLPIPNLVPYQPSGWSDKIVVSKSPGTTTDSSGLTQTNTLYVDWAVLNGGNAPTATRFYTALYVDGVFQTSWPADPPLSAGFYINVPDYVVGPLSVGNHTIKIVTDSTGAVSESDGSDNEYTKTIVIVDDDPNDQISQAISLGTMTQTLTANGAVNASTDVDIYSITVAAGQRISFDIDQTSGLDSYLRVFDASGTQLAANNNAPGPGETSSSDSYLEYTFTSSGTYYIGISGNGNTSYDAITGTGDANGSTGAYTLVVSPGLAGIAKRDGESADYPVDILRIDGKAINPTQRTWIVTHGWTSSRTNDYIVAMASNLVVRYPSDQVLTLDWSAAAVSANILLDGAAEDAIKSVGVFAANALIQHGFTGDKLNLVGHSWGSYVSDELAERIPGGVNTIVALDPGEDHPFNFYYDPHAADEVNFALHSVFSWAFYSSYLEQVVGNPGDELTPTTADEAIVVHQTTHNDIVFMFAYMLANPANLVTPFFDLNRLLAYTYGPWLPNQFSYDGTLVGAYEAVITASTDGRSPQGLQFYGRPVLAMTRTGNNVALAWDTFYTGFVLQSSTDLRLPNSWANVITSPSVVGQSNVVTIPLSQASQFFRLRKP